jgi:hypothetical protein
MSYVGHRGMAMAAPFTDVLRPHLHDSSPNCLAKLSKIMFPAFPARKFAIAMSLCMCARAPLSPLADHTYVITQAHRPTSAHNL